LKKQKRLIIVQKTSRKADEESKKLKLMMHPRVSEATLGQTIIFLLTRKYIKNNPTKKRLKPTVTAAK
jgi:hypothetical protein